MLQCCPYARVQIILSRGLLHSNSRKIQGNFNIYKQPNRFGSIRVYHGKGESKLNIFAMRYRAIHLGVAFQRTLQCCQYARVQIILSRGLLHSNSRKTQGNSNIYQQPNRFGSIRVYHRKGESKLNIFAMRYRAIHLGVAFKRTLQCCQYARVQIILSRGLLHSRENPR